MEFDRSAWTNEGEGADEDPTAEESFSAFEEEATSDQPRASLGQVVPCPLPYLDVYLYDAKGAPIEGAPCELAFPAGGGRKGKTDAAGLAHFVNVDTNAETLMTDIHEDEAEDGTFSYRIKVVPRTDTTSSKKPSDEEQDEPLYYAAPDEPFL
jgi:hypothetical protein